MNMNFMFASTEAFHQPLRSWDVSKFTNKNSMFNGARNFDQYLCDWSMKSFHAGTDFCNIFYLSLFTVMSDPACDSRQALNYCRRLIFPLHIN